MKYLILGCSGMVGHTLAVYLHEKGHTVVGFSRTAPHIFPSVAGDATEDEPLKSLIQKERFDVIINAIAVLGRCAEAQKSRAVYLNALLPHRLAEITKDLPTKIIHISTNEVFSGRRGQYAESDLCDNTTFYGRTKSLGEINDGKNLTLRTSLIGPDMNQDGVGLFNRFMHQRGELFGYSNAVWNGLTTFHLARLIEQLSPLPLTGILHAVAPKTITKYDLLCLFNRRFRGNSLRIQPKRTPVSDFSLKQSPCLADLLNTAYDEMLKDMRAWVDAHPSLYPAYFPLDA